MKRLVWLALLSCLTPPILGDCEQGKAAASGTCGAVSAVAGIASIFACVSTAGLGCGAVAAAGAVSGICAAVSDNVGCGGGLDPGECKWNIFS